MRCGISISSVKVVAYPCCSKYQFLFHFLNRNCYNINILHIYSYIIEQQIVLKTSGTLHYFLYTDNVAEYSPISLTPQITNIFWYSKSCIFFVIMPRTPRYCCLCKSKRTDGVVLHGFPKNPTMTALWKQACGLLPNCKVTTLCVCSRHFQEDNYFEHTATLRFGSIPSVDVPGSTTLVEDNTSELSSPAQNELDFESPCGENILNVNQFSDEIMDVLEDIAFVEAPFYRENYVWDINNLSNQNNLFNNVNKETYNQLGEDEERMVRGLSPEVATPRKAKRALFHARYVQDKLREKIKKLTDDNRRLRSRVSLLEKTTNIRKQHVTAEGNKD
ncbi:uncharacterized protein LOC126265445 isoform X2 [Aethina tumida]|uniref:uncharacterized protein LOC126265445 isoform X2 n=1 Tax=Aethina tumida TaxID=116153 RepID=UPI00214757ED|nr:uncharacterized protein LOC126265445 isoform X2 [Aethina tumida]